MHLESASAARHLAAVRTGEGPPHILMYVPKGRRVETTLSCKFQCRSRYMLLVVRYAKADPKRSEKNYIEK
jgi:hypothetical protein